MKKTLLVFLSIAAALSVTACSMLGGKSNDSYQSVPEETETFDSASISDKNYDIALITDETGIESENNLSLWKSVIAYGDTNCKTYKYLSQSSESNINDVVKEAVEHEAKIIILPNPEYKKYIYDLQERYYNTNFLLIGAQSEEDFAENIHCVKFREEQTGYLAGYLGVLDGYKTLGFIGDGKSDKNMRYLYGMVQGADDATQKLRIHGVTIKYKFIEDNAGKAKNMSKKLYESGVEVIFVCTENIAKGTAQSAKEAKTKMICGGSVFEGTENTSLAYIEYDIVKAVDVAIKSGFDSELYWIANESADTAERDMNLGLDSECINMLTDEKMWKFKNVTPADYDDAAARILSGEIDISDDTKNMPAIAAVVYDEFE